MSNVTKSTTSTNAPARRLDIVPRLMALAMCLNVAFLPTMVFANTLPPDDGNPWKFVKTSGYKDGLRVMQTTAYKSVIVDGVATRVTGTALVVPSASKVGSTMVKRLLMKSPYALLGTAAVSLLLDQFEVKVDKEAQEIYRTTGGWCVRPSTSPHPTVKAGDYKFCSDDPVQAASQYISYANPANKDKAFVKTTTGGYYNHYIQLNSPSLYTEILPNTTAAEVRYKFDSCTETCTRSTAFGQIFLDKVPDKRVPVTDTEVGQYMLGEHPDQGTQLPDMDWIGVPEAFTPIVEDGTNPNWEASKDAMQQTGATPEADVAKLQDTSTTTKVGPDGTTTETKTTTTKNPDGTTTTNTTTTTTKPDGTKTEETVKTVAGGGAASKDLPAFCSWAATVCDWIAWTKTNPDTPTKDTKVPIYEASESEILPNFDMNETRIVFARQCPPAIPINVTLLGSSVETELSYQPLCEFMIMIKPFVIASAYITGAYIISGVGRGGGNDG